MISQIWIASDHKTHPRPPRCDTSEGLASIPQKQKKKLRAWVNCEVRGCKLRDYGARFSCEAWVICEVENVRLLGRHACSGWGMSENRSRLQSTPRSIAVDDRTPRQLQSTTGNCGGFRYLLHRRIGTSACTKHRKEPLGYQPTCCST